MHKRRTAGDPQVEVVAQVARGHGIATPLLDRVVELIDDIEEGRRDPLGKRQR